MTTSIRLLFLCSISVSLRIHATSIDKFYISSSTGASAPCGDDPELKPCANVSEVLRTIIDFRDNVFGIEFAFLPGLHVVTFDMLLDSVAALQNASYLRFSGTSRHDSILTCFGSAMGFAEFSRFDIVDLTVVSCDIRMEDGANVFVRNSTFRNATQATLRLHNIQNVVVIENTDFIGLPESKFGSPGVRILYDGNSTGNVYINECRFENLSSLSGAGLSVELKRRCYGVQLVVSASNFTGNQAVNASAVYVRTDDLARDFDIVISNCRFVNNTSTPKPTEESHGGAIAANFTDRSHGGSFFVVDSVFDSNFADRGAALLIAFNDDAFDVETIVANCSFANNVVGISGTVIVYSLLSAATLPAPTIFRRVSFVGNSIRSTDDEAAESLGSALTVFEMAVVFEDDALFRFNSNTSLLLLNAVLRIKDAASFESNTGHNGGALRMYEDSIVELYDTAHVRFVNNSAHSGGAVFVDDSGFSIWTNVMGSSLRGRRCAFSPYHDQTIDEDHDETLTMKAHVEFINNTASPSGGGGAVRVGAYVHESCPSPNGTTPLDYKTFTYDGNIPAGVQWDVVDEIRVCFFYPSANLTNCDSSVINEVYSGIEYRIIVHAYGVDGRGVLGDLNVLSMQQHRITLSAYHDQAKRSESVSLFPIRTSVGGDKTEHIYFTGRGVGRIRVVSAIKSSKAAFVDFFVNVSSDCSVGFAVDDETTICDCESDLPYIGECKHDGLVRPEAGYWVGRSPDETSRTIGFWCPVGYCRCSDVACWFDSRFPDGQCTKGRGGSLCGQCDSEMNYSATFGSMYPSCVENCEDAYKWEFPIIVAISLGVVMFAVAVNLDVASGFLRPFTLYFQISVIALSFSSPGGLLTRSWIHYVSWIPNLNFRINTCLWDGMTTLQGVVFLYLSPVCIFVFMGIFIGLARRFSRLSRVKVLRPFCSLVTLSYVIISYTTVMLLHCVNLGGSKLYWYNDASVQCFGQEHLPYGIVALLVAVFYVVPFPFFLAFGVHRIGRLRPFADIWLHEFKTSYFWGEGLNFGRRLALVLVHCFSNHPDFRQTLVLVVGCGILGLHAFLQPYKKSKVNTLETVLLVNFCILGVLQCYATNPPFSVAVSIVFFCLPLALALVFFIRYLVQFVRARRAGEKGEGLSVKYEKDLSAVIDDEAEAESVSLRKGDVSLRRQGLQNSTTSYDNDCLMSESLGGLRERLLEIPSDLHDDSRM
ncbi:uncharacterized protein [Oscarella lobularis]|uniref:uncharacterized protein n=1 Tax=Oscarella lobularis TaxID=121494 RepID=UPI003313C7FA